MGTRSLTILNDDDGTEIAVLYRQMDGYPSGHGLELKEFLSGMTITNGISGDSRGTANGGACLAAQVVAHFKTEVGGFYLHPAGTHDCGEEYRYTLTPKVGEGVTLKVVEIYEGTTLFEGKIEDFPGTD